MSLLNVTWPIFLHPSTVNLPRELEGVFYERVLVGKGDSVS